MTDLMNADDTAPGADPRDPTPGEMYAMLKQIGDNQKRMLERMDAMLERTDARLERMEEMLARQGTTNSSWPFCAGKFPARPFIV